MGVGASQHIRQHGPEVADHGVAPVDRIAVMGVPFPALGRAAGIGQVLIEVDSGVVSPDQVPGQIAVGPRDHVDLLVEQEGKRNGEPFIALTAGHGSLDQALAKELEDPLVHRAGEFHPRVAEKERGIDILKPFWFEVPTVQYLGYGWKTHLAGPSDTGAHHRVREKSGEATWPGGGVAEGALSIEGWHLNTLDIQ